MKNKYSRSINILVKSCNKRLGCTRYPADCSPTKGTCRAYALTELMVLNNKTALRFELNFLSQKEAKDPFVALILSKSRNINETDEDIMIVCHPKGVSKTRF